MPQINKPSSYFNTVLNAGDDTSPKSITGFGFQPDLVWTKTRTYGNNHTLFDSVRGAGSNKELMSNSTGAEGAGATDTYGYLSSFDSDGYTATAGSSSPGTNYFNFNGYNYVNWGWLAGGTASSNTDGSITSSVSANTTSGFSIVSYTGNGTNPSTIGHGLGKKPDLMIVKSRQDADAWLVGSDKISGWNWSSDYLHLNATSGKMTDAGGTAFNTAPTSSVFSVGAYLNGSGENYIAYMFTSIKGYSKIGTYTGNGSADGTFVYLGFKPAFVIVKRTDSSVNGNWVMHDSARGGSNVIDARLFPNTSDAESSNGNGAIDFLSNGFKYRTSSDGQNGSGNAMIYMAFAESPLVGTNNIPACAR